MPLLIAPGRHDDDRVTPGEMQAYRFKCSSFLSSRDSLPSKERHFGKGGRTLAMKFDVDDAEADMNYGRFMSPIGGASAAQRRQNSRQPRPAKIGDLHVWTLKERVQAFLDGRAGIAIETANVLLSLALVVLSIVDSYTDVGNFREEYRHYTIFEVVCTAFFAVDYALHWYAAPDRIRYMVTPMGIIDFITIVPTLLTFALTTLNLNSALPLLRIARIFRMLAVLRLYRVVQSYRGFDYQLGVLVFLILALIFVAAGVFQILEESYYTDQNLDPLQFHQAMYFVFVTLSTVGYGDISPHTTGGQFFVIFIIVVVVTVIPKQITRLIELSALQHDYMHSYSLRRRSIHNGGHVVVTGHVRLENASAFLKEFYRPRQGRVNMDVVFLADHVPSSGLQALLLNVRYRRRTMYLKGNLLHDRDAKRAHVAEAAAVFILANKRDPRQVEATDALSILQALAIDNLRFRASMEYQQQFQQRSGGDSDNGDGTKGDNNLHRDGDQRMNQPKHSRPIRCFAEILSLKHTRGLRTITGVEVALNTSQLRTSILARNIVCPGATALLLNLIYSPTERHVAMGRRSRTPWVAEYAGGLQNLIFPVVLPPYFDGLVFESAAEKLYQFFHVMIIALYDQSAMRRGERSIRLCPFGERLEEHDLVFLIAPSSSVAKHAVDSFEERDHEFTSDRHAQFFDSTSSRVSLPPPAYATTVATAVPTGDTSRNKPTPVLVFSSDTVLDRQSFQLNRRPSLELEDDLDVPAVRLPVPHDSSSREVGVNDERAQYRSQPAASAALDATMAKPSVTSNAFTATLSAPPSSPSSLERGPRSLSRDFSSDALHVMNAPLQVDRRRRLHGHILICGPFDQGHQLACYLDQLYASEGLSSISSAAATERRPDIVLLVKSIPSDLAHGLPANVFIERGASQNVEDLLRVRAYEASAVLLVPGNWEGSGLGDVSEDVNEHLQDYQVVMSTLSLRTMQELHHEHLRQKQGAVSCDTTHDSTSAELPRSKLLSFRCSVVKSHESMKYFAYKIHGGLHALHGLHHSRSDEEDLSPLIKEISDNPHDEYHDEHLHIHHGDYKTVDLLARKLAMETRRRSACAEAGRLLPSSFTPGYAAGEVFVDCVLDTLLCQSFFNPYVVDLIRALAGDYYSDATQHSSPQGDQRAFKASMMRYFSTVNIGDLEEADSSPIKKSPQQRDSGECCQYPVLRVATISRELEGESFGEIFSRALEQHILVLGVYRRAQARGRGNALPYVVTCPESPTNCRVERGDRLHVLTKRLAYVCIQ